MRANVRKVLPAAAFATVIVVLLVIAIVRSTGSSTTRPAASIASATPTTPASTSAPTDPTTPATIPATPTTLPATLPATTAAPTTVAPTTLAPVTAPVTAAATIAATAPPPTPAPSPGAADRVQQPTRLRWLGTDSFATGVNLPWFTWPYAAGHGDFGGGSTDGVVANRAAIAAGLAPLQASGTHVVRWWTMQNGAWQIERAADGTPTALDPAIYADFDAAIALGDTYDLYYDFVLFGGADDFPSTWRTDPAQRAALGQVLAPLFARYKDQPRVMSWDIFNEPEFQVWNKPEVTEADTTALASAIIASLRTAAPRTLVTVGSALIGAPSDGQTPTLDMWKNVDLDFYSPHWYDNHTDPSICALCTDAPTLQAKYGTTKPIVIGEYQEGSGADQQADVDRLDQWYAKGYAGAWGWSLFTSKTSDGFTTDLGALGAFNGSKPDIGPRHA